MASKYIPNTRNYPFYVYHPNFSCTLCSLKSSKHMSAATDQQANDVLKTGWSGKEQREGQSKENEPGFPPAAGKVLSSSEEAKAKAMALG